MKSINHCCPGYSTRDRDTCYILNIRISPRVIFLLIRSILVFTKSSYFGFICPDSNKLSKNSRRNPEQIHQMMNPVWKENPLGIMKFDIVEILVLENKIILSIKALFLSSTLWGRRTFLGQSLECCNQIFCQQHLKLLRWRLGLKVTVRLVSTFHNKAESALLYTRAIIPSPRGLHLE